MRTGFPCCVFACATRQPACIRAGKLYDRAQRQSENGSEPERDRPQSVQRECEHVRHAVQAACGRSGLCNASLRPQSDHQRRDAQRGVCGHGEQHRIRIRRGYSRGRALVTQLRHAHEPHSGRPGGLRRGQLQRLPREHRHRRHAGDRHLLGHDVFCDSHTERHHTYADAACDQHSDGRRPLPQWLRGRFGERIQFDDQ